jgi:putative peptidoglycan lipid II flippase
MTESAAAPATKAPKGQSLIRSSMTYSAFTLLSRLVGFARDLAVTATMGASTTIAADAFQTALAFPNLFRRIFAEGAFAAAFVPSYARSLEQDGEAIADELAADAMAVLATATVAITIVAELTMPWLMYVIAPGFAAIPGKFHLAIVLTMLTMPYLPCMAIYAHLSGVLNARNRFILSAAAPALLNFWTLVTVLPAHSPLQAAQWAAIGVIFAGVSQAGLLWWGCKRSGAHVGFRYQLPQGLIGVAIGVALLPQLSRSIHAGDESAARKTMDQAVVFSMAFALPCAVALVTMPFMIIDGLYTRGVFHTYDARQTANALFFYGWGVPAFVAAQLLNRAFFARQDTKTPMRLGIISVVVNVVVGITLFYLIGVPGVAAATTIAWWTNVVMMSTTLARRAHYRPDPKTVARLLRLLLANAVLAALLVAAAHWRLAIEHAFGGVHVSKLGPKEFTLALVVIAAVASYPPLLFASGGLTLSEARAAMTRRKGARSDGPVDLS